MDNETVEKVELQSGSRKIWTTERVGGKLTREDVQFGCTLRIADAMESLAKTAQVISKRHTDLINDVERYQRWYKEEQEKADKAKKSVRALRAVVTRKENEIIALKAQITELQNAHTNVAP